MTSVGVSALARVKPSGRDAGRTLGERLALLPPKERAKLLRSLSDSDAEALLYDWRGVWARAAQLPPPSDKAHPWTHWGIIAGRGAGKTRSAAEMIREEVNAKRMKRIALVGRAAADVRETMIEGESGLLSVFPPHQRPKYFPSKRRVVFHTGAIATGYTSKEPNVLRGPQHDGYWADEVAAWIYPQETWDNLMFGLRLGEHPRGVFTTTPRPIKLIRSLMGMDRDGPNPVADGSVVLAPRMSTYDNLTNLAETFIREVLTKYHGTRLGRQELLGELLLDIPGALWTLELIEAHRIMRQRYDVIAREFGIRRIVVALDPAVTAKVTSDETGIIVGAVDRQDPPHYYVMRDLSGRLSVRRWARRAIKAFTTYGADMIVGEVNNGGDLVETTIHAYDPDIPFRAVYASRGKVTRAEDVAMLYEQGRVHHVGREFDSLEDQMILTVPGDESDNPDDRRDALVWCIKALMRGAGAKPGQSTIGGSYSAATYG